MRRDDLIEIRDEEPDPFWALVTITLISSATAVGLFLMAIYGWL